MRPKPAFWLRLPPHVVDAPTLAAHLRGYAAACAESSSAATVFGAAADRIAECPPRDRECLRAVVTWAHGRRTVASDPVEHRLWESVQHAVHRVAEHLELAP